MSQGRGRARNPRLKLIINFPTGLYKTILPQSPEDRGNITYTISNNTPPRTNLLFAKINSGVANRKRDQEELDLFTIRQNNGSLIFSVASSIRSTEGNNARVYEIGQVLEFSDAPIQTITPMYVSKVSETRHDTNQFDYSLLGLTPEEVEIINRESVIMHNTITDKLNIARQARANAEVEIVNQQKIINDTTRNIDALKIIVDNSTDADMQVEMLIQKFISRRNEAFIARDAAKVSADEYASEAAALQDQLRALATVVK